MMVINLFQVLNINDLAINLMHFFSFSEQKGICSMCFLTRLFVRTLGAFLSES